MKTRELSLREKQAILKLIKWAKSARGIAQALSTANTTICSPEKARNHWYNNNQTLKVGQGK